MIELLFLDHITPKAARAILGAGGTIEPHEDKPDQQKAMIPTKSIVDQRNLFGDGKLSEYPLSDLSPWGFRWVPLYQLQGDQWFKVEPYDENRMTGEHRRRLVLCELDVELAAWIRRRKDLRTAGGSTRPDWEVGLAPRPWKPGETVTPGINPETREVSAT